MKKIFFLIVLATGSILAKAQTNSSATSYNSRLSANVATEPAAFVNINEYDSIASDEPGSYTTGSSIKTYSRQGIYTLNISSETLEDLKISIINMKGEEVKSLIAVTNTDIQIALDVPAGTYFINAMSNQNWQSVEVVVQ